ncbi:ectonucleoside triphosphate diphosphohydrolase 1 [Bombina bombina]|uniref:ectonucleoside triphosphate diphosphohydrolase 1 n=1 Tax=Bombina bombina TaxID=8345 RepID=UPI00235A4CF9|nr:ectonucleoside triphosphate diphosphohydrolase 1 [Bombina bombina]
MEEPKVAKQKKTWHRNVLFILGVLFSLGIIALVTTAVIQNKPLPQNIKYGIVLDAGSSHTNLYIYDWPAEKENDTGVVKQLEVCKVEGPGISSYSQEPAKAGVSLQTCLKKASNMIPENRHSETPVYLGATAGMRLLRLYNSNLADDVLAAVADTLRASPFDFQGARIITGQEEGAYGWTTINYLLGNFIQGSSWLDVLPVSKRTGTSGALDLGGASTQITFESNEKIESQDNSLHFRLYGKSYNVYTHSFLCYGKDQALRLQIANRIQNDGSPTIRDPCFNSGYRRSLNTNDLYSSPCVSTKKLPTALSDIRIEGSGNYEECKQSIQQIFNKTHCTYSQCSFDGIYQPVLKGEFGAFSAFYFVMDYLKLTQEKVSLEEVKNTVAKHCSKPWDEIKNSSKKTKEKYLSEYCFSGIYILTLLELGYGFTSENWNTISFLGKVSGSDAGWTLGFMLNLTNLIPAELPPSPPLSQSTYIGIMVFLSLLLFFILLTCWVCFRKPRCLQKGVI